MFEDYKDSGDLPPDVASYFRVDDQPDFKSASLSNYPPLKQCYHEYETDCDPETQDVEILLKSWRFRGRDADCSTDWFQFSDSDGTQDRFHSNLIRCS